MDSSRSLALDPVHDLQRAVLVALHVGDVLDEVVGLPVEPERVQRPQREGGVAHPAVAVVPVARSPRGLGQRGRRRGDERAGGHERQPLQRERRALQVKAPRVVGIGAFGQPRAPEVAGAIEARLGFSLTPCFSWVVIQAGGHPEPFQRFRQCVANR